MSAILSSADLNDFISPGVACIKPVEVKKTSGTGRAEVEISIDGQAVEATKDGKRELEAAQISLSDCLACSGCITSAESVLVSMQSHKEVMNALRKPENSKKIFVCSVSHQVRVSLAAAYNISVDQVDRRLKNLFLKQLGFKHVVGLEVGRAVALHFGGQEAIERYRAKKAQQLHNKGPLLSSSCPGWTCYVEKTHEYMIPYLSKVKSPQQIMGTLVKRQISDQYGVCPKDIYHLALMPCFDKKLEASRPEFTEESHPDVDCVITAKEIVQLLLDEDMPSFDNMSDAEIVETPLGKWPIDLDWLSNEGSSSGGYMDHVIAGLVKEQNEECTIETIMGKNSDIVEYHIRGISSGQIVAKTAQVYGFRNIQNLVRKLKTKATGRVVSRRAPSGFDPTDWDYAEVMACPGGCLNGGGQIGKKEDVSAKEWKSVLEGLYNSMEKLQVTVEHINEILKKVWTEHEEARLIQAEYHGVDKSKPSNIPKALEVGSSW